jgi:hypothetical protein
MKYSLIDIDKTLLIAQFSIQIEISLTSVSIYQLLKISRK